MVSVGAEGGHNSLRIVSQESSKAVHGLIAICVQNRSLVSYMFLVFVILFQYWYTSRMVDVIQCHAGLHGGLDTGCNRM